MKKCTECFASSIKNSFFNILRKYVFFFSIFFALLFFSLEHIGKDIVLLEFAGKEPYNSIFINTGMALIIFAIFGAMLDTKNWKAYFSDRLSEIIQTESYLSKLDVLTLNSIKTKIYKILHKSDEITDEKSFFTYIDSKLSNYISMPYRRDVVSSISVSLRDNDEIFVEDSISYTIVKVNEKLFPPISWFLTPGEVISVTSLKISVLEEGKDKETVVYEMKQEDARPDYIGGHFNIHEIIPNVQDNNEIRVKVQSNYVISADKFFIWQMVLPTYSYMVTIKYPENFDMQFEHFGLDSVDFGKQQQTGLYNFKYDSWMLPRSGVAWKLIKKQL